MTAPLIDPKNMYAHMTTEERLEQLERRFRTLATGQQKLRREVRDETERFAAELDLLLSKMDRLRRIAELQTDHAAVLREAVQAITTGLDLLADGMEDLSHRVRRQEALEGQQ